jgi:hypothetical protein
MSLVLTVALTAEAVEKVLIYPLLIFLFQLINAAKIIYKPL